jgi:DNA-binding LacI/PurR family transcriptional regulator
VRRATVTQKQIAERAGVSQATVSLVLNGSTTVSIPEATRELVKGVAADLGYVPQTAARNLVRGTSGNLGLILVKPHAQVFIDPYIPHVMTGVSEVAHAAGYRILVEHIDPAKDDAQLEVIQQLIKGKEVAGAIFNNTFWTRDLVGRLIDDGYPIVSLDDAEHPWKYTARIDHRSGIRALIDHLAALGRRRIACVTYGPPDHGAVVRRIGHYRQALVDRGLEVDDRLLRYGLFEPETGYGAARELLAGPPFDALYCMNDAMALGAMKAIRDAGRRIPEDVAVVGYDDMRFAAFTEPPLTTVRAPEIEQGRLAGEMVIELVNGREPARAKPVLEGELVIRGSSRSPGEGGASV